MKDFSVSHFRSGRYYTQTYRSGALFFVHTMDRRYLGLVHRCVFFLN